MTEEIINYIDMLFNKYDVNITKEDFLIIVKNKLLNFDNDLISFEQLTKYIEKELELYIGDEFDDSLEEVNDLTCYLNNLKKPLTIKEEKELGYRLLKQDLEAKKIFIESNLTLVVHIANKYKNKGIDFFDLIQEGNIGLIKAVERFDVTKGYRFSTYAVFWIEQKMRMAIAKNGNGLSITRRMYPNILLYREKTLQLQHKLNRKPNINEIADFMKITLKEATEISLYQNYLISLNSEVSDCELLEIIDSKTQTPEETFIENEFVSKLRESMHKCLSEKQFIVLYLRYGFDNKGCRTLKQIGDILNITRQGAYKIERTALKKLKNSKDMEKLLVYIKN